jgi:hypothetical protein
MGQLVGVIEVSQCAMNVNPSEAAFISDRKDPLAFLEISDFIIEHLLLTTQTISRYRSQSLDLL